jgi:hypothetical protein
MQYIKNGKRDKHLLNLPSIRILSGIPIADTSVLVQCELDKSVLQLRDNNP